MPTLKTRSFVPEPKQFLAAVGELAASLGWQHQSFKRDEEIIAVVALDQDPSFEQAIWVYDVKHVFMRCLLVNRSAIPPEHEGAILELCARINDGLSFGCVEYCFDDRTVIFRDSADLQYGALVELVMSTSTRLLDIGSRYAPAIRATLTGSTPLEALNHAAKKNFQS
jgi:hypothetical protein